MHALYITRQPMIDQPCSAAGPAADVASAASVVVMTIEGAIIGAQPTVQPSMT